MRDVIAQERSRGAHKRSRSAQGTTKKANIDLARAAAELEDAARTFPSQRRLEEAAWALAEAIRKDLPTHACAEPWRAGVSHADRQAYDRALRRGKPGLDHSRFTVLYSALHIVDGEWGRTILARDAQDVFPDDVTVRSHWWLLEPLVDDTKAPVSMDPEADGFPVYHKATPAVLLQFAEEARDLIADFARELQRDALKLTEKVQQLEQLAAAPAVAS